MLLGGTVILPLFAGRGVGGKKKRFRLLWIRLPKRELKN